MKRPSAARAVDAAFVTAWPVNSTAGVEDGEVGVLAPPPPPPLRFAPPFPPLFPLAPLLLPFWPLFPLFPF